MQLDRGAQVFDGLGNCVGAQWRRLGIGGQQAASPRQQQTGAHFVGHVLALGERGRPVDHIQVERGAGLERVQRGQPDLLSHHAGRCALVGVRHIQTVGQDIPRNVEAGIEEPGIEVPQHQRGDDIILAPGVRRQHAVQIRRIGRQQRNLELSLALRGLDLLQPGAVGSQAHLHLLVDRGPFHQVAAGGARRLLRGERTLHMAAGGGVGHGQIPNSMFSATAPRP